MLKIPERKGLIDEDFQVVYIVGADDLSLYPGLRKKKHTQSFHGRAKEQIRGKARKNGERLVLREYGRQGRHPRRKGSLRLQLVVNEGSSA